MAFKFQRNASVSFEMGGSKIDMKFRMMSATALMEYHNSVSALQEKIEEGGAQKHSIDMYELMIDMLAKQAIKLDGIEDEDGNSIELPGSFNEKAELFDALGIQFITEATAAYMAEIRAQQERNQGKSEAS